MRTIFKLQNGRVLPKKLGKKLNKKSYFQSALLRYFPFIADLLDDEVGDTATYTRASSMDYFDDSADYAELANNVVPYMGSGILAEPAHTNLSFPSRIFTDSRWVAGNASISLSAVSTPYGSSESYLLRNISGATNVAYIRQERTISGSTDTTVSITAKAASTNFVNLQVSDNPTTTNHVNFTFDLSLGTNVRAAASGSGYSAITSFCEDLGDGWYRCTGVFNSSTDTTVLLWIMPTKGSGTVTSDANDDIRIVQHDVIQNGVRAPQSPVETTVSTTATQANQAWTIPVDSLPSNNFQFYFEAKCKGIDNDTARFILGVDTAASDGFSVYYNASGGNYILNTGKGGGTYQIDSGVAPAFNTTIKGLITYSNTGTTFEIDSGSAVSNTSANGKAAFSGAFSNAMRLGANSSDAQHGNFVIGNIKWAPGTSRTLSEMESLT